jgi:pyruvate dehydrogenase E1 component
MDRPPDIDPLETREWLDALEGVIAREGPDRAHWIIEQLIDRAAPAPTFPSRPAPHT